jgi:hypothetical protein
MPLSRRRGKISPKNDLGFFGGIKLGYVFGTGVVRPTVEGDFFLQWLSRWRRLHVEGFGR